MIQALVAQHFRDKEHKAGQASQMDIIKGKGRMVHTNLALRSILLTLRAYRQGIDFALTRCAGSWEDQHSR